MTLTKANIVEAVAEQIGYTKNQSFELIETLLEIIKQTLESGEDVLVSRFGKFCVFEDREQTIISHNELACVLRLSIFSLCLKFIRFYIVP